MARGSLDGSRVIVLSEFERLPPRTDPRKMLNTSNRK